MGDLNARAVGDLPYGTPIDLTNCEREPIHIPGQIQAHGVLLAFDADSLRLLQASDNTLAYLQQPVSTLLGEPVSALFEARWVEQLKQTLSSERLENNPLFLFSAKVCGQGPFHVIGHVHEGVLMLELEVPEPASSAPPDFYELLKRGVSRFQSARTAREFSQMVVEEVRRVSGYDRVMVYHFAPDWSGHVVAESMAPDKGLESYLGLHYPASDIPAQARALFLLNTVRMLPDARYQAARLVPEINPRTHKPLDLSYTFLRGASQMYTEYLNNMGVRGTLSLALARGERLWGMLVCHHYAPRKIPYDVRAACELLARFVSVQMLDKVALDDEAYRGRSSDAYDAVVRSLARHEELDQGLVDCEPNVRGIVERSSVAVVTQTQCRLLGDTPNEAQVRALVAWLRAHHPQEVFSTDALSSLYPPAAEFQATACGVLAVELSRSNGEYVLWMRPELIRTDRWAGDPSKPVETGPFGDRLTPRKSFALWQETVRGRSSPFTPIELEAAGRLRAALVETVLMRGEKLTRAAHRSRSLLQVADALAAARTEEEAVEVILGRSLEATGAQGVVIARLGEDGRFLEARVRGLDPTASATDQLEESAVEAVRTKRLVVRSSPGAGTAANSRASLPLGDPTSLVGAITFFYPSPSPLASEIEEFLRTLAKLCGQALQRARLADQALSASEAYRGSLVDSLEDHVAVLDPQGLIVEVNEAWRRFGATYGAEPGTSGVGANYLQQCEQVAPNDDDGTARRVLDGIRNVIAGRVDKFGLEYACLAPGGRRWFALRVSRAAGRQQGSVVVSHSDVTTIKQTEEQLRTALREKEQLVQEVNEKNHRIEEANRLKSEFLANMSHELRTPLNGIIGFSELMYDGKAGPLSPSHREYLGDVLSSARHLHDLINDVLDLTKVESGKLEFRPEPVNLLALLTGAVDLMRLAMAKKNIRVDTRVDPQLGEVEIDPARLKQVMFNYLSNALKFTPDGGTVTVSARLEGERFRLEVEDTGIGIPEEQLHRLFVEFEQLDASKAKKYAGSGLGLALTKRIVEAQGGEVGARSIEGKGSVFFAVLPRRPRPATES